MIEFKGTKGKFSFSPQKGTMNHCFQAQIWTTSKETPVADINSTKTEGEANANAELFVDALNTVNVCGLSPIELLEQRNDLLAMLFKSKSTIAKLRRSISVHPDCEPDSEFEGFADMAIDTEAEIKQLTKKITK